MKRTARRSRRLVAGVETQKSRPTWQAALLVFLVLAGPVWVILTLIDLVV